MPEDFSQPYERLPFTETEARTVTVEVPTSDGRVRVEAYVTEDNEILTTSITYLSVAGGKERLSAADDYAIKKEVQQVFNEQWAQYTRNIKDAAQTIAERGGDP